MSLSRHSACTVALKGKKLEGYGPLTVRAAKLMDGGSRWLSAGNAPGLNRHICTNDNGG